MTHDLNLPLLLAAGFVAAASPGPAIMAIAGASMSLGRRHGLALAAGVTTGSWAWSVSAALGLSAVMLATSWAFEFVRYTGAVYLLFLAYKSARSALRPGDPDVRVMTRASLLRTYGKGLALHLTNPKAVLFFGSLYAIAIPPGTPAADLSVVVAALGLQSFLIFLGYALLFSSRPLVRGYMRVRKWFEMAFALVFGVAGLKLLTARLP